MRTKTATGLCSLLVGIGLLIGSGIVVVNAVQRNTSVAAVMAKAETNCREKVSEIAAYVPEGDADGHVKVLLNNTSNPQEGLSEITAILAMCPHRKVVDACFGTTCGPNGRPSPMRASVTLALQ